MDNFQLESTIMTPGVNLNPSESIFKIWGNSRPENPLAFYRPIFDWLTEFFSSSSSEIIFELQLNYFNTSTSKVLLDLFEFFEEANQTEKKVHVVWQYPADDEEMMEAGQELFELVAISCELKAV
jgi:hypothetical protein